MKGISLSAVLQVINLERQSCDIHAKADGKTGQLHFRDGDLVDAAADDLGGEDAAYAILGWDNPEFEVSAQNSPVDRSISTGLTTLLLETARRKDEEGLNGLDAGSDDGHAAGGNGRGPNGHGKGEAALTALGAADAAPDASGSVQAKADGESAADVESAEPAAGPAVAKKLAAADAPTAAPRAPGALNATGLKRVIDIARDGLGDALLSADVYSSADGTSFVGINSKPAACALFNQVTSTVGRSLKKSGLPALGRCYMAELEGNQMMLVAPSGHCQLSLLVDSTRVQLGLLLNVILPEVLAALEGVSAQ